jgi:hypothetical protein
MITNADHPMTRQSAYAFAVKKLPQTKSAPFRFGLGLLLFAGMASGAIAQNMAIYTDSLQNSWADWSYSVTRNFSSTAYVHGGSDAIAVTLTGAWGALSLEHGSFDDTIYTNLTFWINGGATGGQLLQVYAEAGGNAYPAVTLPALTASTWQQITLSLSSLGVANQSAFTRFSIQDRSGLSSVGTYYVDDISLQTNGAPPPPATTNILATVSINATANQHPISPLIYGVAFASSSQVSDLNAPINRSGGNAETRYNWLIDAHNRGGDWYFESIADGSGTPGADADSFISGSKSGGADPLITIPMIGWECKLGPSRAHLSSFSVAKYGAQQAVDPYWSDAGNGVTTGGANIVNDPTDDNFATNANFQLGWLQHLTNTWGTATNGGVKYYLMDNEETIWFSTHRDVHPVGPTMQEIYGDIVTNASLVKSNDPNALVLAPEEWGWGGYINSGYDQQNSGGHDRANNGGMDYCPWLLNQLHQHDVGTGQRLLDYFTLHCYPQEGNVGSGSDVTTATSLLRNQSTRVLWDPAYTDPSWIGQVVQLIPRMKNWVATYYPGTKIGITEYNWGAETYINGATAQADIFGIFGSQGLDLATRWTVPATDSLTYNAMKMYRNYDGNKSTFGDVSISDSISTNVDLVSSFAALRSSDGAMTVMVINKQLSVTATVTLNLANFTGSGTAHVWQLTSANTIMQLSDQAVTGNSLTTTVPAQSITLFVLPAGVTAPPSPTLTGSAKSPPGSFSFTLNGQSGRTYVIYSTTDLTIPMSSWTPYSTNTLSGSTTNLVFSFSLQDSARFFMAEWAGY